MTSFKPWPHGFYTVLIRGQSGTGKELVAQALHQQSRRNKRPLVAVNCPAIPEFLLESELFGHKKGAFTGANSEHIGLFAEADGSTLLLDEIGDIPVSLQTKLLRVLEEQELRPLGGTKNQKINVRILASTNQNLEAKIQDRTFRDDLFYRLNVITVQTPTLREIREDIPLLADYFSRKFSAELAIAPPKRFSLAAMEELMQRNWPGNTRELQNFVRRMLIFCREEEIQPIHIHAVERPGPDPGPGSNPGPTPGQDFGLSTRARADNGGTEPYIQARNRILTQFTRGYMERLLFVARGNISRAAKMAGLSRVAIQKIIRRMQLNALDYRNKGPS